MYNAIKLIEFLNSHSVSEENDTCENTPGHVELLNTFDIPVFFISISCD